MSSTFDLGPATTGSAGVELADLCAPPSGLSSRELAERLVGIECVRRQLEAATLSIIDEADRSGEFRDDGHITVGSWARATVNWSVREASERTRSVQLMRLCPAVGDELAGGRLGVAQTYELARARANPRVGDQIIDRIDELIQWGQTLGYEGFRKVVGRWEQLVDVDGAHQGHEAAHDGRRATMTRFDDTFHLNAQFGVTQGTAMSEILEAFAEAEFLDDRNRVKAEHGDAARPSLLPRTALQRRADALHAIFMAAIGDGPGHTPGPVVNLVCDQQTFEEHLARLAGGHVPPDDSTVGDRRDDDHPPVPTVSMGTGLGLRRCETIDGAPVDPGDVVAAALIGQVRRVVVNSAGVVVNCGRKTRLFTGVAREMAWLLGTTCCWPGCGHRRGVQVDHLDDYARDGPTDQANADPLDGRHNRFKTNHSYRVRRDDRGFIHVYRPDGSEIRPR